ncbi:MAG TPA: hypothetical protein PLD19_11760, partial [Luteimonas sp.]|nr:hypothetical protein [Luteimonas sp.]
MTPERIVAVLLAAAVVAACLRLLLAHRRDRSGARRWRPWRQVLLLALQPLLAAALYLTLYPPAHPVAAGALTVLTAGATPADAPQA